ncbi:MAG: PQQ-binding-like beta-propeller repeat protein [Flavisolibacter sp.]|nr:PQQ-binding-like beta-propeller repeat protein [Flavisolibacter sp.]
MTTFRSLIFNKISCLKISFLFSAAVVAILLSGILAGCNQAASKERSQLVWSRDLPVIGSQSSPRTADLNKDGVLDIVIGAGKNEFQKSDMGILAFDGKTGSLLWKQEAPDQVFGSATFCDVTGDGVKDVLIGGRSPQLKAIDGKSGALLWEFKPEQYTNDPVLRYARYNFNNSVLVPDKNGDGIDDLLTVNGGNALAAPYSEKDRYPGVLMLLDSKTGHVLAADTMPDGKESYMTPLCFSQPGSKELFIVFGTGGETIDGNLYLTTVSQLLSKNLSAAKVIATEKGHGFIAPATLADITKDGYLDIIAISHGSKAVAIDGKDYHTIWTRVFPGTECSNSFAAGYFTGDDIPDFFTFTSKGQWPNSKGTVQVMINGKDGSVAYTNSIGCTGFSSPVVYDLDGDGRDEAIISVNEFDCSAGYAALPPTKMKNKLIAIDFSNQSVHTIDEADGLKNIFSTPWIGDLDNDGYLDMIYCQYYHHWDLLSFLGMRIKRIDLPVRMNKKVQWGAFLGSNGNGVFNTKTL